MTDCNDLKRTLVAVFSGIPGANHVSETVQDALRETHAVLQLEALGEQPSAEFAVDYKAALDAFAAGPYDRIAFILGGARLSQGFLTGLIHAERQFVQAADDAVAVVPTPWALWTSADDYCPNGLTWEADDPLESETALAILFNRRAIESWSLAEPDFRPACFVDLVVEAELRSRDCGPKILCTEAAHAIAKVGDAERLLLLGYE
jgi:hypothetical protein